MCAKDKRKWAAFETCRWHVLSYTECNWQIMGSENYTSFVLCLLEEKYLTQRLAQKIFHIPQVPLARHFPVLNTHTQTDRLTHTHTHTHSTRVIFHRVQFIKQMLTGSLGIGSEILRHVVHSPPRSSGLVDADDLWSWWHIKCNAR